MATLIPVTQPTNVEAAYEDMFKEITRKLYGEETGNGLHTLGTPVAHVVSSGGPTVPEGEERSFTTLMSDRHLAPTIEYEQQQQHNEQSSATTGNNNNNNFKTDEHLTTAFGLAALMQNGFQAAAASAVGTILPKASTSNATITSANNSGGGGNQNNGNNNSATSNTTGNNEQQQQQQRWNNTNDEILSWPIENKLTNFSTTSKPNKTPNNSRKNKTNNSSNNTQNSNNNQQPIQQKRYTCTHCPYSTDRRDLYTRHENIHKDEKPFQCYACLKQFNRADHVKKHFLRMHRELTYDINKTRRSVNNNNNSNDQKPTILFNQQQNSPNQQQITENFLNVATNNQQQRTVQQQESTSLSIAQTIESVATAQVNSPINNNNHHHHQQHQLPIQLKQEKLSPDEKSTIIPTTTATIPTTNKIKREKRFTCCYCPWSGADKWGLKRHLNTHTKPFVCMLCDYKAARSERLATHVLKVHNKKACNKCSFLADNQEEFQIHMNDIHPHDNRPSRNTTTNSNVLRTIGNTLGTNNQLNNFQQTSNNTSFGIQTTNNGVTTTIYTNNDISNNNNNNNNNSGNLQDIIVNPTSMVGWRLSASGSLIPPINLNESTSGGGNGNPNQKRGAERLFQYLEADGSDPEDYARLLKMDAISRNTASVAQDFHNAGGVVYNNNNNNNINQNQNLTTGKITRQTAAQLPYQQQNNNQENNNNNLSDHRKSSINKNFIDKINYNNQNENIGDFRKAMSSFLIDQQLINKSPPAYLMNQLTKQQNNQFETTSTTTQNTKGHRINNNNDFNKENTNLILSNMNSQNISKLNQQFQNYIKDIINKYYAETPLLNTNFNSNILSSSSTAAAAAAAAAAATVAAAKTETENYIEYLKSKDDITLIVTSSQKKQQQKMMTQFVQQHKDIIPSVTYEKRNRKQAQPKKVLSLENGPEISIAILRDKYLKKLVVDRKRSCITCTNNKTIKSHMLVFPYHTLGSLVLHRLWKHSEKSRKCQKCNIRFMKSYSLKIHLRTKHKKY